jgi:hypothetical protein
VVDDDGNPQTIEPQPKNNEDIMLKKALSLPEVKPEKPQQQ